MSGHKHTPGEWFLDGYHRYAGTTEVVAQVFGSGPSDEDRCRETAHANALLVAAAPELATALEDLIPWAEGTHESAADCDCDRCERVRAATAALKKAGLR